MGFFDWLGSLDFVPTFLLCIVFILILGINTYGIIQFYTRGDRLRQLRELQTLLSEERDRVWIREINLESLKRCVRWEKLMFHNFSSQEVAELDALEEMLRQNIKDYMPKKRFVKRRKYPK